MPNKPVIFISAVSRELKSARQLIANTLESFDVEVVVQEMFGAPAGDLRDAIREKIDRCHCVIHLVGQQYGFEPPSHDDPFDPCSYTQYEARYGRTRNLKVWFLVLDDAYPPDNASAEGDREAKLQQAWRLRVRSSGHLRESIADLRDVKIAAQQIAHEARKLFGPAAISEDANAQRFAKIEQALAMLAQEKTNAAQAAREEDPAAIEARAYATLEKKLGLKEGILAGELPRLAERLLQNPDTSHIERARALYAEKKYAEAEAAALKAKTAAIAGPGFSARDALEALMLAGDCAREQIHYRQAIDHLRAAAVFTDLETRPVEWAHIAHRLASLLFDDGQYAEAEKILRAVIDALRDSQSAEHPDTLASRNNLANALNAQGKYPQAEQEHRAVLLIHERVLGPQHPATLASRSNLALVLDAQGKYEEAEQEHRTVLASRESVLGPEAPDTYRSKWALASVLQSEDKHQEAEVIYKVVIPFFERVLGPEHPDTLTSRSNLANALRDQGKNADSENEHRAVLAVRERVLGAEHPDTLTSRNNLGADLYEQGKYMEAEAEHRAWIAISERVMGREHPHVLGGYYNLALALKGQKKLREALDFARRAEEGRMKILGSGHPDSKNAKAERESIQAKMKKQKAK